MGQKSEELRSDPLNLKLERLEEDVAAFRQRMEESKASEWRKLLGNRLDDMMMSSTATERFVGDPDPNIRRGALSILALHWKPIQEKEWLYMYILFADPDPGVRIEAIGCLISLYEGTRNRKLCTDFARIVRDISQPLPLRRAAYIGIILIEGMKVPDEIFSTLYDCDGEPPVEPDWKLVDSFLT